MMQQMMQQQGQAEPPKKPFPVVPVALAIAVLALIGAAIVSKKQKKTS